tara:strand:+ start:3338 stop:4474 length:1137 start_codon:yes stop_codon:yes gene_type:complete
MKFFKIVFFNIIILVILLEIFSFTLLKLGLFTHSSEPTYGNTTSFIDIDWRNEKNVWGAWHIKDFYSESKKNCFDVSYKSNNIGARDDKDYFIEKGDTILLGDSFAEGIGVNLHETFAGHLSKSGRHVLNFASAGDFGPLQQYLIYKNLASEFNHNEIIIFFLPANDFTDNSSKYQESLFGERYRPYFRKIKNEQFEIYYPKDSKPSEKFPSTERENSFKLKSFLVDFFYSANLLRQFRLIILSASPEIQDIFNEKYGYNFEDEYSVDGVLYYFEQLFKLIDAKVSKTFIVIPTDRDLREIQSNKWEYLKSYWYKEIKNLTKRYDIKFIDLALDSDKPSNELLIAGQNNWYHKCDGHWSRDGHKYAFDRFILLNKTNN